MTPDGSFAPRVGGQLTLLLPPLATKAVFSLIFDAAALYEAALKVYTKPLFYPEKGCVTSHDGRTLFHFAVHGRKNLDRLHASLAEHRFHFSDSVEIHFARFEKGRRRTLYILPWEDRIVDQWLWHRLNKFFNAAFSPYSYAFRHRGFGVDCCQHRIARLLASQTGPVYIVKRDISNFYPSIDQDILLNLLEQWIDRDDYLFQLVHERVKFWVRTGDGRRIPGPGVPLGAAFACLLANVYLTPLDIEMMKIPGLKYFRYADDILALAFDRPAALQAAERFASMVESLRLKSKASHELNLLFARGGSVEERFRHTARFQHLGLQFRADGTVSLPRTRARKIHRMFRRAFEAASPAMRDVAAPEERARILARAARQVVESGRRPIAIVDYYLKHVDDDEQLRLLDRWLAEEVLARAFVNGHCKGNFRRVSFKTLRDMGLPSLRHRGRLLRHGQLTSTFFTLWSDYLVGSSVRKGRKEAHAERRRLSGRKTLSPHLEAAAENSL